MCVVVFSLSVGFPAAAGLTDVVPAGMQESVVEHELTLGSVDEKWTCIPCRDFAPKADGALGLLCCLFSQAFWVASLRSR